MRKVFILIMLVMFIFRCTNAIAIDSSGGSSTYQFEDYKWGTPINEIKQLLKTKEKHWTKYKEDGIGYRDTIFNYNCEVYLSFTPKDRLLATIAIKWDNTYIGSDLKKILTKKYGKSFQDNKHIEEYVWDRKDQENLDVEELKKILENPPTYNFIILNYHFFDTTLFYYGGEYHKLYLEEKEQIANRESYRF